MNLKKELIFGKGYSIFSIDNMNLFKRLRSKVIKKMNILSNKTQTIDKLRESFSKMSKAELNQSMINLLSFTELSEMMVESCSGVIKNVCGSNLFVQRRAHTIVNIPGEGQAKQWPHYELMSGISPFTYVIWAPLHDLEDQGGVYYIDLSKSSRIMKDEEKTGIVNGTKVLDLMTNQEPAKLKFGQAIIFNPFVLHGNISFKSKYARVACNVRFQSSSKPLLQKNSDYLKFYKVKN